MPEKEGDTIEIAGWRRFWDSTNTAIAFDCRRYLYDKADGKAHQTINHVHDKPLEMNVNVSMAEIIREVRHRKQEYERSRN